MRPVVFTLAWLCLFLAACAPGTGPTVPAATSTPVVPAPTQVPTDVPPSPSPTQVPVDTPIPGPTPTHIPVDVPPALRAAIATLASELNISADQIKVVSSEAVNWPDGCLGVVRLGVMCIRGPIPGFRIVLEANGTRYELHTNQNGSVVTPTNGTPAQPPDAPVAAATKALATAQGVTPADVKLVSAQLIEWPDGCLGIALPGVACSQIVTTGYLIVLEVNGQQYEYHTNQDGSAVRPGNLALTWQRIGGVGGFCDALAVYRSGEIHAAWCKPASGAADSRLAALGQAQQALLQGWLSNFGAVSINQTDTTGVDGMSLTLTLLGSGNNQPSPAEQKAMLDWAQSVLATLQK